MGRAKATLPLDGGDSFLTRIVSTFLDAGVDDVVVVVGHEAQAIVGKHCLSCHARNPSHPAFKEPPKNVALEDIAEMRRFAQQIYMQTVQNRAMPLGNQTGMTEDERAALGRWVNGRK